MSTRHLRKLQQRLPEAPAAAGGGDASSEDSDEETPPAKAPFNPFDLLTDDEEEEEVQSQEEEQEEEEDAAASEPPAKQQQQQQQQQPGGGGEPSKPGKKGKKKKGAAASPAPAAPKAAPESHGKGKRGGKGGEGGGGAKGDDIDAILAELDITTAPAAGAAGAGASPGKPGRSGGKAPASAALLAVDVKRLRGDDELRRIFGASVIEAVDRQDAAETGGGRGGAARRYGWAPRNMPRRRPMKRGTLVAPRDDWPYYEPGTLLMEAAGTAADGTPMFRYVWPGPYRGAQALFEQAQGSYDPNAVAAVLHQCPYHVDSLLAMSDLYRAMGEGQYAEESLNRALYALEAAWSPGFDPSSARCRLDIEVPENRALFVALFRHAQALSRRGCHSSALEVAKLLLALDPSDPLGALQLMDYLALRAGRYGWLERFVQGFDGGAALALLPNFAYSLALARYWRETQAAAGGGRGGASTSVATAAAAAEEGDEGSAGPQPSAHNTLVSAMLLHPLVVPQLMGRLQGQGVGKDAWWGALLERRLFAGAGDGGSATLAHLVSIFVERSHLMWKAADVQAWMRRAADAACDAADGKAAAGAPAAESSAPPLSADDWAAVARESFPATDANEFRHLRLSDFSDAVNALPREELAAAMEGGGGVAGLQDVMDEAVLAQIQEAMAAAQAGQRPAGPAPGQTRVSEAELQAANPLVMLLRSLLPWVDAGEAPDYAADDDAQRRQQGGGGGGGGE